MRTTLEYLDSSMLKCYLECPRKFFFTHICGWHYTFPSIHLTFGSAWHAAIEELLRRGYTTKGALDAAFNAFLLIYREDFSETLDLDFAPKNPGYAEDALSAYIARYASDNDLFEVLYTEVGDCVEIDKDHLIYLKLDALCRRRAGNGIFVLEHKTASYNNDVNREKWHLDFQIGTYLHALEMYFPKERILGVTVNIAFIQKSGPSFLRIDTRRSPDQLAVWLWTTRDLVAQIEYNLSLLRNASLSDPVLGCFPCNYTSCTSYNRMCSLAPYCAAWANPLGKITQPPAGWEIAFWDPRPAAMKRQLAIEIEALEQRSALGNPKK